VGSAGAARKVNLLPDRDQKIGLKLQEFEFPANTASAEEFSHLFASFAVELSASHLCRAVSTEPSYLIHGLTKRAGWGWRLVTPVIGF
jgi:hypothetical protein